jgi:hypothetical protein
VKKKLVDRNVVTTGSTTNMITFSVDDMGSWSAGSHTDTEAVSNNLRLNDSEIDVDYVWNYTAYGAQVTDVVIDSSGDVYTSSKDNNVLKIDSTGSLVWNFSGHTASVYDLAIGPSENIYTASRDNTVRKLNSSGMEEWSFTGHTDEVNAVKVDSAGNVYSGGDDDTLRKIDSSGSELWTFNGHSGTVEEIEIGPSGNIFTGSSVSSSASIRKIDTGGNELDQLVTGYNFISGLAVDASGDIYFGDSGSNLRKIDGSGSYLWNKSAYFFWARDLFVDGDKLYSASEDREVQLFNSTGAEIWRFEADPGVPSAVIPNSNDELYVGAQALNKLAQNPGYISSGSYVSQVYDAGEAVTWNNVTVSSSLNGESGDITVQFSDDDFSTVKSQNSFSLSGGLETFDISTTSQYVRFNVSLSGSLSSTPEINSVDIKD